MTMDRSIRAKFRGDRHVLGPFLGNLPPEILDAVVRKLGWFRTTFAMAGRTCREAVERVPSTRAVLLEELREGFASLVMNPLAVAVMEGDDEALEWLIELFDGKGLRWRDDGTELSRLVANRGTIESLTCLRANGCPWNELTCADAAGGGHLEVLQWARENGCPWDEETCAGAAEYGHLDVLQWAHENGCPWDEDTWRFARNSCRPYLIERGCPGTVKVCEWAAREGLLRVLKWARENGCPWDAKTWSWAHSRCRPYLLEHGCPGADESRAHDI